MSRDDGPDGLQMTGLLAIIGIVIAVIASMAHGCAEKKCKSGESWVINGEIYKCHKTGDL